MTAAGIAASTDAAATLPPAITADWDGMRLRLHFGAAQPGGVDVELDGACFLPAQLADAAGRLAIEFPFSPSGRAEFAIGLRATADGRPLLPAPLGLRLGRAGIAAATPPAAMPAPLAGPARLVPFDADLARREVLVAVPVFNAPALVRRCLDAVLAHGTGRMRLVVVDDASTDPAVAPLLARYAGIPGVTVLANPRNLGFTATVNRCLALAGEADVVLLNADAEVGPNWLAGLQRAACAEPAIGTATAVSDNAGAFSVPELERHNPFPAGWSFHDAARALWQGAGLAYPELPTGNGFCMYIRREVLARVPELDAVAFPQGYGEENDFCQRAASFGFRHVIAGNVLVRHAGSASFGDARRLALGRAGMAVLRERWPDYERLVGEQLFSFARRVLDWRVRAIYAAAAAGGRPRPRVLRIGVEAAACAGLDAWHLRERAGRLELLDAAGCIVDAADGVCAAQALWRWLQVHVFEACLFAGPGSPFAAPCRRLGVPQAVVAAGEAATVALHRALAAARAFPGARP